MPPRKKRAKAVATQPAAVQDVIVVSSDQPEPAVIELSSDSSSARADSVQVAGSGAGAGGSHPEPVRPSPRRSKRQTRKENPVEVEDEEDEDGIASAESGSPSSKRRKLPMRVRTAGGVEEGHRKVEIEIPISTWRPPAAAATDPAPSEPEEQSKAAQPRRAAAVETTPKKGNHIHFGEEEAPEADQFYTPLEAPAVNPLERLAAKEPAVPETAIEEESNSDDDDAPPEAVSTSAAAAQTLKAAQITAKAVELQAAAQKRKRKERDSLFKAQAEKRKRLAAVEDDDDDEAEPAASGAVAAPAAAPQGNKASAAGRQRLDKAEIPALLPAEFLESDSEDGGAGRSGKGSALTAPPRPKRIKFHTADRILAGEGRAPADRRVGHTLYRILGEKKDVSLAPKMRKHTKAVRMELLARKRPVQRPAAGGFFVKRK